MTDNDVPNLDAMDPEDLRQFAKHHALGANASELFPEQRQGISGPVAVLARYAAEKACAMSARAAGHIQTAQNHERKCDVIYRELPEFARW